MIVAKKLYELESKEAKIKKEKANTTRDYNSRGKYSSQSS